MGVALRAQPVTRRAPMLLDRYGRPDDAASLGNAERGGGYTAQNGTWGTLAGKAYLAANNAANDTVVLDSGSGNGELTVDVTLSATNNRADTGVVFRDVDANNYMLLALTKVSGFNQATLYKRIAGTFTQLDQTLVNGLANGTTYRVRISYIGTLIRVYIDDVLRITFNTSTGLEANTKVGFRVAFGASGDDGGSRFDNLRLIR